MAYLQFGGPTLKNPHAGSSGGGVLPQFSAAAFWASLKTSLVPEIGSYSSISYNRASKAYVKDNTGRLILVNSGEARFWGAARYENLVAGSEAPVTQNITTVAGTYEFSIGPGTGTVTFTGTATGTLTANANDRQYIRLSTTAGALTCTMAGSPAKVMGCDFTNLTGYTHAPYVSKGALSSPYHGAMVDGVKYFSGGIPEHILRGLRVEPAGATTGIANAEDTTTADWTRTNVTATAAAHLSPAYDNKGNSLADTVAPAAHALKAVAALTGSSGFGATSSVFLKANTAPYVILSMVDAGGTNGIYACIDMATKQVTEQGIIGTGVLGAGYGFVNIEPEYIDGWFKACLSGAITGVTSYYWQLALSNTATPGGPTVSYIGTGQSVYLWCPQIEAGYLATSPILTPTAMSTTRAAETLATWNTVAGVSLANGTYSYELTGPAQTFNAQKTILEMRYSATEKLFDATGLYTNSAVSTLKSGITASGATNYIDAQLWFNPMWQTKMARRFKSGDHGFTSNGKMLLNTATTYATATTPTVMPTGSTVTIELTAASMSLNFKNLAIWPTAYTNSEIQALTSPDTPVVLILDGDSLTYGQNNAYITNDFSKHRQLWRKLGYREDIAMTNLALTGSTIRNNGANTGLPFRWTNWTKSAVVNCQSAKPIFVLMIGVNDVTGGQTATQVMTNLKAHIATMRAAGFEGDIVLDTNIPAASSGYTAVLRTHRDNILSEFAAGTLDVQAVADIGIDTHFDAFADCSDVTYYNPDLTHLTTAGTGLVASYEKTQIEALIS